MIASSCRVAAHSNPGTTNALRELNPNENSPFLARSVNAASELSVYRACFLGWHPPLFDTRALAPDGSRRHDSAPKKFALFSSLQGTAELTKDVSSSSNETAEVEFVLKRHCLFGESFFIVGEDEKLGNWCVAEAVPLKWSEGDNWTVRVDLASGIKTEFKYILLGPNNKVTWQPGRNCLLELPTDATAARVEFPWGDESNVDPEIVVLSTGVNIKALNKVPEGESNDSTSAVISPFALGNQYIQEEFAEDVKLDVMMDDFEDSASDSSVELLQEGARTVTGQDLSADEMKTIAEMKIMGDALSATGNGSLVEKMDMEDVTKEKNSNGSALSWSSSLSSSISSLEKDLADAIEGVREIEELVSNALSGDTKKSGENGAAASSSSSAAATDEASTEKQIEKTEEVLARDINWIRGGWSRWANLLSSLGRRTLMDDERLR